MNIFKRMTMIAALALGLSATTGVAAVLQVDTNGQLTGALNVDVSGTLYDVRFEGGTCATVFGSCSLSRFDFTDGTLALAASQALLDQVFVDGVLGNFNTAPELQYGISNTDYGRTYTPYYVEGLSPFIFLIAEAANADGSGTDGIRSAYRGLGINTALAPGYIFARWTPSNVAVVPLPAGGVLLLSALGGMAALRRRKKRLA